MSDEILVYPTNSVVGVATDRQTLDSVRDALRSSGVDEGRVEVLCGQQAADRMDAEPGGKGPIAAAIRIVQTALGEEATRLGALNDALEAGSYVVIVELPEDDDVKDAEKANVGNALHDAGARDLAYYGPLAIEELQMGA